MRRLLMVAALVLAIGIFGTGVASADGISPTDGSTLGKHIAQMAPEHPIDCGSQFGKCVSTMASDGVCPHHPDAE